MKLDSNSVCLQIYHGQWRLPNGDLVLEGFGFEEDGKLIMRYGNLR